MAALALSLAACGSDSATAKVRIGLNPWPGYLNLAVAEKQGYFGDEGLQVQIVEYSSLHDMARAYRLGQIDFMPCTLVEVLESHQSQRPAEVIWVADSSLGADQVLARGAETAKDLRGKKIAYEPNSLGLYVLARMLERSGLGADEVDAIGMDQTEMVQAMREGNIDAAVTYPPSSLEIAKLDGIRAVFTSGDIQDEVIDVFSIDPKLLDAEPDWLERFYRAMARTEAFMRAQPDEAARIMSRQMGIAADEWPQAQEGMVCYGMDRQLEWIWGSNRLPEIVGRLQAVLSTFCGPRQSPKQPVSAKHRRAPETLLPAAPR